MLELLQRLCAELDSGRCAALATIVHQQGSAPRGAGSRLLAGPDGLICGTTGGGLAEARVIEACAEACETLLPRFLDFEMDGTLAAASEMICGGRVRVLVEPFVPNRSNSILPRFSLAPEHASAELALEAARGRGGRIVRPFPPKETAWSVLYADGSSAGASLSPEVEDVLRSAPLMESAIVTAGGAPYFCDPCRRPDRMIILGGGHVSRPTAAMAAMAGFEVHVVDDRPEFASAERFPQAVTHVSPDYAHCLESFALTEADYVVIVTRGHLYDKDAAEQALRSQAGYIGMIGSTRKREQIYRLLLEQGFTQTDLGRIHSPIGLDIGAETPEEIAVSILAECIAYRHGVPSPKWRKDSAAPGGRICLPSL
ncbi:MAG: XdhC family protein [Mailhella sp.]|nr:XdhC family protein [Mailhella sp.]MBQ4615420.1 XdhC family protein [Mailhella sp.]MBR6625022.1 XdhC family protein [Mailhella sp.]